MSRAHYLVLLALSSLSVTSSGRAAAPEAPRECVHAWYEVRYGNAGYDHIVRVSSGCRGAASCQVSSDVAPQPIPIVLPSGATQEVVTMRGSPAREFTPRVECQLASTTR